MGIPIEIQGSKTLKLSNPLFLTISLLKEDTIENSLDKMDSYISRNRLEPVGPLIQQMVMEHLPDGNKKPWINLIRQTNICLCDAIEPFSSIPELKVDNCLYTRFYGAMRDLHYAYDKLYVMAYEQSIQLRNETFTVFLDQQDPENVIIDIFVEKVS